MKSLLLNFSSTLLFFIPFILYAGPAHTVAPLIIDEELQARDIITRTITITNTGTQPLTVYPSVNNIALNEGGTIESFLTPSMSDRTSSLSSWIEIPRKGIKLPVGEVATVDMTLRINPFPQPGEYHALIGFGWGSNSQMAKDLVEQGRAPGVIVKVTIGDDRKEALKLSRFIIDRFVTKGGNQGATYSINNPGDVPLTPSGEIIFYNNRGEEVASVMVNESEEQLAPGEVKEFKTEVPVSGLFGKYKAMLTVEYGSSQLASVNDVSFFYVFPLRTLLIILGVLMVIAIAVALYVHKRYLNEEEIDDSDFVPVYVRENQSEAKDHDIDLKLSSTKETNELTTAIVEPVKKAKRSVATEKTTKRKSTGKVKNTRTKANDTK